MYASSATNQNAHLLWLGKPEADSLPSHLPDKIQSSTPDLFIILFFIVVKKRWR
jgi:hypothetical protein